MSRKERAQEELKQIITLFSSRELPNFCARALINAPEKPSSKWSFGNQILMLLNGTTDARGFNQWKRVNRFARRGSRAFYILAPILVNKESEEEEDKTSTEVRKILVGFTSVPVFRFEDTEGQDLPVYQPRSLPPLLNVAEKWNLSIKYERLGHANGAFSQSLNTITLATENEGTFFHELAHAAHSRIEKVKAGQDPEQEAVAQLTAATLARVYGFNDDSYSWHYISGYAGQKSPRAVGQLCLKVLSTVQKVVSLILTEET